ncbi:MAG: hypothetical protein A2511_02560 [Deltaproteobacteria bacterium RIFOXYD12_FULL_50_9]|nr:MAG: hypothetical protein A2511_02560 [Deltaproteobacteria bacterium RIFOXYD12_FULL_50_9]
MRLEPPHDQIWHEPLTGMQFVWVKGGCFQMGCGPWSGTCQADEKPVHEVCVDGFWMGKFEATQEQWQKVMGANPSRYNRGGEYPVEQVSVKDVEIFVDKLNAENRSDNLYRLPTEAEWEYAARSGGEQEIYAGGINIEDFVWHRGNSDDEFKPVGSKKPNGLGLHDMSGNVYEWCSDRYGQNYYSKSLKNNPVGPSTGEKRVIRGGSAASEAKSSRTTNRSSISASCLNYMIGVRLIWAPGHNRRRTLDQKK